MRVLEEQLATERAAMEAEHDAAAMCAPHPPTPATAGSGPPVVAPVLGVQSSLAADLTAHPGRLNSTQLNLLVQLTLLLS